MFEELINKKIKCVWKDGDNSKGIYGIVENIDKLFISIRGEQDYSLIHISIKDVIMIKEVKNG